MGFVCNACLSASWPAYCVPAFLLAVSGGRASPPHLDTPTPTSAVNIPVCLTPVSTLLLTALRVSSDVVTDMTATPPAPTPAARQSSIHRDESQTSIQEDARQDREHPSKSMDNRMPGLATTCKTTARSPSRCTTSMHSSR